MRIAIIAGLSLAQIGEFSFVLSQAGVKAGLLTPELYQIFLAASIATMGLTPLCLKYRQPGCRLSSRHAAPRLDPRQRRAGQEQKNRSP